MEISHTDYTIQAIPSTSQNTLNGVRKVFSSDPALNLQLFLTIPVFAAGIVLNLNAIQWILIIIVSLLFLVAGIFRTAALLQVRNSSSISSFHESRIRSMGNALVAVTAGISLLTYLLVFVPKITQFL